MILLLVIFDFLSNGIVTAAIAGATQERPAAAPVWPLPSEFSSGATPVAVVPRSSFFALVDDSGDAAVRGDAKFGRSNPTLEEAFRRYAALTFPHPAAPDARSGPVRPTAQLARSARLASGESNVGTIALTGLSVSVSDLDETTMRIGTDESYTLSIARNDDAPTAAAVGSLRAATVYGALRGLETFSQLVSFDFDAESYGLAGGLGAPIFVRDEPRFPHRGLMIDTARHYLPLATIRHVVDSISYAKLNVLHWHVSDTQSFPLQVTSRPKLWGGSFSKDERYLQTEVAEIVEHARKRGVRVVPEFDVPGHAASWCVGYPEVCPSDPKCPQPLNVARNETFRLLDDVVAECAGGVADDEGRGAALFPDDFFHLGGDEVDTGCWRNDSEISAWLEARGFSPGDGYAYFVRRAASIALKHGRRPVQWSEVYDHFKTKLDPKTVVHIWKSNTNVTEVAANGYDVLINVGYANHSWYLDNLGYKWDNVYTNEPCRGVPDEFCSKVLGGHGEMWGETVDASDIDSTVWPRLAAVAERLWSPRHDTERAEDALARIEAFRCLLNGRGVGAAPVTNDKAREGPSRPGSCYEQRRRQ